MTVNVLGHGKRRIVVAHVFLHFLGDVGSQRRAVAVRAACFCRAVTDNGVDDNQRRFGRFLFRTLNRLVYCVDVVAVGNLDYLPALRLVTLAHVLGERRVGVALDGDVVAVVKHNQLAELPGAGERSRFALDALHHAAVAAQRVGVVVDDVEVGLVKARRKHGFGNSEAHCVGNALTERSRRGFHAGGMPHLGVTRGARAELTEIL